MTKAAAAIATAAAVALTGCATTDPTAGPSGGSDETALIIGSNAFPEAEIIAEIYAQALEHAGLEVERRLNIGARQQTYPAMQDGSITLMPEYSGNLLLHVDPDATATTAEAIDDALPAALEGSGLTVLNSSPAQDQDAYVVTRETATANGLTTIADLAGMQPFSLASNPQFAELSYGIPGLAAKYGITDVTFVPFEDYGGPDTLAALLDGTVQVADIYTTSPAIAEHDLVVLEDTQSMITAQNIVPLVADSALTDQVRDVLNGVSAELTTEGLIALRGKVEGGAAVRPADAASQWLQEHGITSE